MQLVHSEGDSETMAVRRCSPAPSRLRSLSSAPSSSRLTKPFVRCPRSFALTVDGRSRDDATLITMNQAGGFIFITRPNNAAENVRTKLSQPNRRALLELAVSVAIIRTGESMSKSNGTVCSASCFHVKVMFSTMGIAGPNLVQAT